MAYDFSSLTNKFDQVLSIIGDDLNQIKTGRAKPSLVEDLKAEAYGAMMPLKELASITAPDAHMILIQPWDQSVIAGIEKALHKVSLNPTVDGQQIRIVIAPLTGEKRQEMVKQVAQHIESGKQMLRNERTDAKKLVEAQKGTDGVSEDDISADIIALDKMTHEYNDKLDAIGATKKTELETI